MKRGDIVLVNLPKPASVPGHEQFGSRPALVVHDHEQSGNNLSVIMIVPMTSKLKAQNFSRTILLQPSSQNGLSKPSVLLVFQLRAIDKKRIQKKIGVIEASVLKRVNQELQKLLGI